jgi:pimeloyl-ACP methyl ester carboxylesterase
VLDVAKLETKWFGPPAEQAVVLLHEGLGCVDAWRDFPEHVRGRAKTSVFAYSRFGYGRSPPVSLPRPLSYMHDEARLLPEVLREAGIARPLLVGHSDGASIAIIAAGSGLASRGLVLLAPHVFCEERSVRGIEDAREAYEHGDLRARLAKYHADVDVAFWGWNRAWLDPAFRAWNIEEFLPRVTAPVAVVQGDADPYGTLAQVDAIARGVPAGITRVISTGAGHAPHREREAEVLEAIALFTRRDAP